MASCFQRMPDVDVRQFFEMKIIRKLLDDHF